MKRFAICLSVILVLTACNKEDGNVVKKSLLSARIGNQYPLFKNAVAQLVPGVDSPNKGQLVITGEDNTIRLTIIIKSYAGETNLLSFKNEVVGIYTNKSTNVSDTALDGRLDLQGVTSHFVNFPELPASTFTSRQIYKSETIKGAFQFNTKNSNTAVSDGLLEITFNK